MLNVRVNNYFVIPYLRIRNVVNKSASTIASVSKGDCFLSKPFLLPLPSFGQVLFAELMPFFP